MINSRPPPGSAAPPASSSRPAPSQPVGVQSRAPSSSRSESPPASGNVSGPPEGMETLCCPKCSKQMRWRVNRSTGAGFFGCTGYPECKATVDPNKKEPSSSRNGGYGPAPDCPNCSKRMRLVQGSRGPFFGCTGYPNCQTSVDVTTGDSQDHSSAPAGRIFQPKPSFRRFG